MTIRKVLNIHELTAVAIQEGVIDERVYRRWFNGTYISDYEATKDYIAAVRTSYGNKAFYLQFEQTALRWSSDKSWYAEPNKLQRKRKALTMLWRA